eukprot:3899731-Rhodomonas_salina.2
MTADTTADSFADVEAGMGPEYCLLPPVSSTPSVAALFPSGHHDLPSPPSSNLIADDSLLLSVAVNSGIMPDSSLCSSPISFICPPAHLANQVSPLHFSNVATHWQDSLFHDHTDRQESVISTHFNTEVPPSSCSLASNWVPANSRARPIGGRQRRVDPACFRCKARRLKCDGNQPGVSLPPHTIHGVFCCSQIGAF